MGSSGDLCLAPARWHACYVLIYLDDVAAPELDDYFRLTDVHLRRLLEPERGVYMAESTKVIERALQAGHQPRSFLSSPRWLPDLQACLLRCGWEAEGAGVPVYVGTDDMLQAVTGFKVHRGALAAMHRPELADVATLLSRARAGRGARRVVVLEGLVDHTNVGAIFRSCAGLGVDAVLVTDTCADPLYRRSVRVSMGTVFQVPWTRIHDWPRSIEKLHELGFLTAALALENDAETLDDFAQRADVLASDSRVALILGTEGDGLSARTVASAQTRVIIPMAGHVDSLNVAAASAVACWALRIRD